LLPLCGNANNIWELVAFRFIQGLGGGALLVTAQTIITESYPVAKRGMAQAIYGMGVIVGPLGPPLEVILSIIFLGRIFFISTSQLGLLPHY
jgi:DHA2 family multidrug resistance protein